MSFFEGSVAKNVLEDDWYYIIISLDFVIKQTNNKNGAKTEITTNKNCTWRSARKYCSDLISLLQNNNMPASQCKRYNVLPEMLQTKFSLKKL